MVILLSLNSEKDFFHLCFVNVWIFLLSTLIEETSKQWVLLLRDPQTCIEVEGKQNSLSPEGTVIKRECPLKPSQSWHMMKNQKFSYSAQR